MNSKILRNIKENGLINDNDNIILAVSGGSDSMSLLYFFIKFKEDLKINNFIVCHVNHNLRGVDSDYDENLVLNYCKDNNIKCLVKSFDILELSKIEKKSIELTAREYRYKFFNEVASLYDAKIVTAHNLNDSIETFVYNSIRGTSIDGLCGIPIKRDNIIRPLFNISKNEIDEYCENNNINFSVDKTNFDTDYSRNKIRNDIIPYFNKINDNYLNNFKKLFELINEDKKFIDSFVDDFFKKNYIENKLYIPSKYHITILKRCIKKFLLINNIEYNKSLIDNIINIILNKKGKIELEKNKYIFFVNNILYFEQLNEYNKKDYFYSFPLCNFQYIINKEFKINLKILNEQNVKSDINVFKSVLDYDKIKKAILRNRRNGDFLILKNRNITKKLKKFFNEEKINVNKRFSWPIIAIDNRVIYIYNHYLDLEFVADDKTKNLLLIDIQEV